VISKLPTHHWLDEYYFENNRKDFVVIQQMYSQSISWHVLRKTMKSFSHYSNLQADMTLLHHWIPKTQNKQHYFFPKNWPGWYWLFSIRPGTLQGQSDKVYGLVPWLFHYFCLTFTRLFVAMRRRGGCLLARNSSASANEQHSSTAPVTWSDVTRQNLHLNLSIKHMLWAPSPHKKNSDGLYKLSEIIQLYYVSVLNLLFCLQICYEVTK
jgi:hypothetical protein